MLKYLLKNVRVEEQTEYIAKQIIIQVCIFFILGTFLGMVAKYSDTIPSNGTMGVFFHFISIITTRLEIWVVLATIIAAWSKSPKIAAIRVFALFIGMLLAYYIYSQILFGSFPIYYFLRWGGIAAFSPILAYIMWFSRGEGWVAAFCAALPIGLLFERGYPFFYMFSVELRFYTLVVLGFDIFSGILLLVLLPSSKVQCIKIVTIGILIALVIRTSNILSYLFGGL